MIQWSNGGRSPLETPPSAVPKGHILNKWKENRLASMAKDTPVPWSVHKNRHYQVICSSCSAHLSCTIGERKVQSVQLFGSKAKLQRQQRTSFSLCAHRLVSHMWERKKTRSRQYHLRCRGQQQGLLEQDSLRMTL